MAEANLRALNPELRHRVLPKGAYELRVPPGQGEVLLATLDKIPVASSPGTTGIAYHRVRKGETLSTISRRYRTSMSSIMRANNLRSKHRIVAGTTLKIPVRGSAATTTARYTGEVDLKTSVHKVRSGDSLWILARRYGTTVKQIQAANNMHGTRLHVGQKLKIPTRVVANPPKNGYKTYTVKRGDTPYTIARSYKMPLNRFLAINSLTPRSKIYPGQCLNIE
jgi:membrane-bound lytic murein transglycosylase D